MKRTAGGTAAGVVALALVGCLENKEQTAEIARLTEEIEEMREDSEADRARLEELEKESKEARDAADKAEHEARKLESKLADAERDLERFKTREAEEAKRPPTRIEKLATAKKAAEEKLPAVASVNGDKESGNAVLVEADGKTWLYAPASLIAANKKLEISLADGTRLQKFGAFAVAEGADLARLEVQDAPAAKLKPAAPAQLESGIALLGVDAASALVEGRSYDIQGGELRVDSQLAKNQPGTPVFHGESGELLGVLAEPLPGTETRDLWGARAGYEQPDQRLVVRLDREVKWTVVPIAAFLDEEAALGRIDRVTRLMETFVAVAPGIEGMNLDTPVGGAQTARQILEENKTLSAVRALMELDAWLKDRKMKPSETDVKRRVGSVYGQLANEAKRQAAEARGRTFSPFHQAAAKQSLGWLAEAEKKLLDVVARSGG